MTSFQRILGNCSVMAPGISGSCTFLFVYNTIGFVGPVSRTINNGEHDAKHGERSGAEQMFR